MFQLRFVNASVLSYRSDDAHTCHQVIFRIHLPPLGECEKSTPRIGAAIKSRFFPWNRKITRLNASRCIFVPGLSLPNLLIIVDQILQCFQILFDLIPWINGWLPATSEMVSQNLPFPCTNSPKKVSGCVKNAEYENSTFSGLESRYLNSVRWVDVMRSAGCPFPTPQFDFHFTSAGLATHAVSIGGEQSGFECHPLQLCTSSKVFVQCESWCVWMKPSIPRCYFGQVNKFVPWVEPEKQK